MSGPTKRVSDMSAEERLESLKAWAEEQKYVQPGEGGTLGNGPRSMSISPVVYSGPVRYVQPQYDAPIAPPSYETAMATRTQDREQKAGPLKRWLHKRKERKNSTADANAVH